MKLTDGRDVVSRPIAIAHRLALRPKEAAAALGISERKLRELLPELPHVRRAGVVMLPVDALRRWLDEQAKIEGRRADAIAAEVLTELGGGR